MQELAIATYNLSRRFDKFLAVDRVNLRVPSGSVYGFLGPNGAGKTTTIRMLLGLIHPSEGEVFLCHHALKKCRPIVLGKVGSLVETPSLYPHLTGRENLELVRRLLGARRGQIERVLKLMHLEDAAEHLVRQYSPGMRQRLGLALALLNEPELLILDEPTNGLDPAGICEVRDLIVTLAKENGVTIFLSSHLLNEVEQMATHLGIIQRGRMLFQGTMNDLQARLENHVLLGVDQPEKAAHVLARQGWTVRRYSNGAEHLQVSVNGASDAALLNAQLVTAGVNVFHLSLSQPSLEQIFFDLTEKG